MILEATITMIVELDQEQAVAILFSHFGSACDSTRWFKSDERTNRKGKLGDDSLLRDHHQRAVGMFGASR